MTLVGDLEADAALVLEPFALDEANCSSFVIAFETAAGEIRSCEASSRTPIPGEYLTATSSVTCPPVTPSEWISRRSSLARLSRAGRSRFASSTSLTVETFTWLTIAKASGPPVSSPRRGDADMTRMRLFGYIVAGWFLLGMSQFVIWSLPAGLGGPLWLLLAGGGVYWLVRHYRAGKEVESIGSEAAAAVRGLDSSVEDRLTRLRYELPPDPLASEDIVDAWSLHSDDGAP